MSRHSGRRYLITCAALLLFGPRAFGAPLPPGIPDAGALMGLSPADRRNLESCPKGPITWNPATGHYECAVLPTPAPGGSGAPICVTCTHVSSTQRNCALTTVSNVWVDTTQQVSGASTPNGYTASGGTVTFNYDVDSACGDHTCIVTACGS